MHPQPPPAARTAEEAAALDAELQQLHDQLGVQRGAALSEALKPELITPMPDGLREVAQKAAAPAADPPPASFGHTSCASSGTAPSRSTVLTIQSASENMHLKCLVGYCLRYIAKRYLSIQLYSIQLYSIQQVQHTAVQHTAGTAYSIAYHI